MKKKVALIFGITGQDGSYLAEFLLKKNYIVHGVKRRSSSFNTGRLDHLYQDPHEKKLNFKEATSFYSKSNEAFAKLSFEKTKEIRSSLQLKGNLHLKNIENQRIKKEIELDKKNNTYKNFIILLSSLIILILVSLAFFQYKTSKFK